MFSMRRNLRGLLRGGATFFCPLCERIANPLVIDAAPFLDLEHNLIKQIGFDLCNLRRILPINRITDN